MKLSNAIFMIERKKVKKDIKSKLLFLSKIDTEELLKDLNLSSTIVTEKKDCKHLFRSQTFSSVEKTLVLTKDGIKERITKRTGYKYKWLTDNYLCGGGPYGGSIKNTERVISRSNELFSLIDEYDLDTSKLEKVINIFK